MQDKKLRVTNNTKVTNMIKKKENKRDQQHNSYINKDKTKTYKANEWVFHIIIARKI